MADEGKRILIVEDEKPMARAVSAKLENSGFSAQMAGNGDEALAALAENAFDLVLLDLVMPRTDGWQVLEKMRQEYTDTPVIVATNLSQAEDEKRALDLGAKDFLVKSNVSITEVVERIKKALGDTGAA